MPRTTDDAEATVPRYPKLAGLWATGVYLVASLSLAYPALAGQFLVNPRSDQYIAGYAFREFAAASLRQTGHFPLWNPYLFGGLPYVAAMHGDIFYPTFLLRMVMPTDLAMTWGMIIHLFLAGLFTFFFLRAIGLGFFAALVGGLAYMLGGNIAGLVSPGHDGKLFMSALLPVTLLLLTRGIRDGKLWSFGALAFVLGLAILTPHPQLLQYLLLLSGSFALVLAFGGLGAKPLARRDALRRLALAAGAVVVGLLIGAVQFVPVREYVPWSPRAAGHAWDLATSYSMPPEEMLNFLVPQFSGMLDLYWGRNFIHLHSEYIGAVVLVLVALAFTRSWQNGERRFFYFWIGALVLSLLWALGGFTPFYRIIYAIVPGTKFFRAPSTMLFIVAFSSSMLAALGVERAMRGGVSRRFLIGWGIVAVLIALIGVSGGLTNLAVSVASGDRTADVLANDPAVRAGTIRSVVFLGLALAILFVLQTGRVSRSTSGILLAAAVALDLWSIERIYWMFSPRASVLYASDGIIDYLKKQTEPFRVLPLALRGDDIAFHDPFLTGDALMTYRIRSALGYHGNELGRYQRLEAGEQGSSIANPNFWALENIKFIMSANGELEKLGLQGATRIMGPVKNAAGTNVFLYQIAKDNPAAWLTPVIVKAPDDNVLATVLDPRFDVRGAALFDSSAKVQGQTIQTLPPALTFGAHVTRFDPGAIDVQLDQPAPKGSALVVSENYYPGWQATADGRPAVVGRADLTLIGVELPAGAKAVTLRFTSASYELGKTITLVALLVAVLGWAGGAVVGRRASA